MPYLFPHPYAPRCTRMSGVLFGRPPDIGGLTVQPRPSGTNLYIRFLVANALFLSRSNTVHLACAQRSMKACDEHGRPGKRAACKNFSSISGFQQMENRDAVIPIIQRLPLYQFRQATWQKSHLSDSGTSRSLPFSGGSIARSVFA